MQRHAFHLPGGLIPGCLRSGLSCLTGGFLLLRIFSVGSSVSPPSGFLQLGAPSFSFRVSSFLVVLCQAYRGLTDGFLLLRIFSVGSSVSPHVCFILDLILISMFLR